MKTHCLVQTQVALAALLAFSASAQNETATTDPQTNAPTAEEAAKDQAFLKSMGSRGMRVHDPSTIVKCGDEYWIFHTGNGVSTYRSKDLVEWAAGPRIFTNSPAWVAEAVPQNRRGHFWAPDVIKVGNRYLVYYSVSSFGRNTSAIALVSNATLDPRDPQYEWKDEGIVVQSQSTNDYNAIDPALFQDEDGSLWMSFGSFWGGIKMIQLNPETGKRIAPDSKLYSLAHFDSIEAPFIYKHDGHYYLFVNWGMCCRGLNSTYNIRVGRSQTVTGPYLDKEGKDLLVNGGTPFLDTTGKFIGPGHAGIYAEGGTNWFGMHFYDGTTPRGTSTLAIRTLSWGADGWPVLDPPKLP